MLYAIREIAENEFAYAMTATFEGDDQAYVIMKFRYGWTAHFYLNLQLSNPTR